MTDQEFSVYLGDRYAKALEYYDKTASHNKFWHRASSLYILIVSISITPILTNTLPFGIDGKTLVSAFLAPSVAIATGLSSHFRFHENWISFRAAWDALKHEVPSRDAKIGPYADAGDRNAIFVNRVEALISQEGIQWYERHASREQKKL